MRRPTLSGLLVLALAVTGASCAKSDATTAVAPTPTATTETFTGTLNLNAALTFPFIVTTAGSANATLTALDPDMSVTLNTGGTGNFQVGELVYQGDSFAAATMSGTVYAWNPATGVLSLRNFTGSFSIGSGIFGVNSGAQWSVASFTIPVVGMALGTWTGTTCTVVLANDVSAVSSTVTGAVQASGSLCARVYDVGQITTPATFTLEVTHF